MPELNIVAKSVDTSAIAKLKRAGANRVVSPKVIGGRRLANELLRPSTVRFLDTMAQDEQPMRIEDVAVPANSAMIGKTLDQTRIREHTGALVLAIHRNQNDYSFNPSPKVEIEQGMGLVVWMEPRQLPRLRAGLDGGDFDDGSADGP